MSSPEVEKFEVTDEDFYNEFNPNRKTFRMSKKQATYGVWADDSDEEKPAFKGGGKNRDFTAPMNFVSGGVKVGDKVTKEEEDAGNDQSDSDEEFDRARIPSGFGSQKGFGRRGVKKAGGYPPEGDGIGNWEKHTKGIGQKLLAKMGHVKGQGLGKNNQGISTPVEAFKRRGKGAVGYHGSERTDRSLKDYPTKPDSEEEEEKQFQEQVAQWKKGKGDKKKKPKYIYKTADELLATGSRKLNKKQVQSELTKVKVIDMTGREQRVLSGYQALSQKHDRPEEDEPPAPTAEKKAFDMPELLHNLDLLVDMSEDAILENAKKLQYEEDLVVNLNHEKGKLESVCSAEEKQIMALKEVLQIVEECERRTRSGSHNPMTLEEAVKIFHRLQEDYYEEYKLYELSSLAVALVFPMMKKEFEGWNPLKKPRHGIVTMKNWKSVLSGMGQPLLYDQGYMDPYDRLIWEVWMPVVRNTINTKWSVRDCDVLLEVLEAWMPFIPEWVMSNILEQLVFPKLNSEVESWNPLTDTMPIHAWLHPWLPLMGDRLEPLYGPIRHKLSNALTNWHPSDPSAKMILQPWMKVFSQGHMEAFLAKNISPKLSLCMQEFLINPHEQHLDGWKWVMSWSDIMPKQNIVAILEKHFFPKWIKVLTSWLTATPGRPSPNYEEVTKWYMGWKTMFAEFLAEPVVKDYLGKALEIMNRAVTGQSQQPGARENIAYLTSTERRRDFETQQGYEKREYDVVRGAAQGTGSVPMSFKDLVEKRAEEYEILFMPLVGKTYEAKQIYMFGKSHIYFDRNVVFRLDPQTQKWVPVSLNNLMDRSK